MGAGAALRYQDGLAPREAIRAAVGNRVRPIFMSATTSLLGMLPLVLSTGAGSELYRGLGSILLGGLALAWLFYIQAPGLPAAMARR